MQRPLCPSRTGHLQCVSDRHDLWFKPEIVEGNTVNEGFVVYNGLVGQYDRVER